MAKFWSPLAVTPVLISLLAKTLNPSRGFQRLPPYSLNPLTVNSLFTLAIFVGLAWNPSDPSAGSLASGNCAVRKQVAKDLVSFHVYSFVSFLFSSLVALCLKQAIRLVHPPGGSRAAHINRALLRAGILASTVSSVFGCGFLMLALINVIGFLMLRFYWGHRPPRHPRPRR